MSERYEVTEILHHLGERDLPDHAVAPPLFQTSIFCFNSFDEFQEALADEESNYLYTRGNNPTVNLCEEKLAALEHAEKAKLVGSGVAAISCAVLSQVKSGDHVVSVCDTYSWTRTLFSSYLKRFGVSVTYVEGCSVEDFERAIRPETVLIYLESPATFTFKLQPLREVAELARSKGIKTIIDNTWATPIYQNPLDYGIDIVVHSASKYLGGHSDLVAGAIMTDEKEMSHIFNTEFLQLGPVPDPHTAWLIMRNLRTLHLRMPVHYSNALELATFLEGREEVESVLYPFLPSFPQYELAKEQMRGGSGLFSFRLKTRRLEDVRRFTDSLHFFKRAVSWGGYESLVVPAAANNFHGKPIPDDRISLIRLHAGLEDVNLLKEDLEGAFKAIG